MVRQEQGWPWLNLPAVRLLRGAHPPAQTKVPVVAGFDMVSGSLDPGVVAFVNGGPGDATDQELLYLEAAGLVATSSGAPAFAGGAGRMVRGHNAPGA